jgi:hypothetical protein
MAKITSQSLEILSILFYQALHHHCLPCTRKAINRKVLFNEEIIFLFNSDSIFISCGPLTR